MPARKTLPNLAILQQSIREALRDPAMKGAKEMEIVLPRADWKQINAELSNLRRELRRTEDALTRRMEALRLTASELNDHVRSRGERGIHPSHAANRIRKVADEIAKGRE
jgi:hypothetical protein